MLDSISIALKIALEYVVILWWLMVKDVMMEILEMEMVAIVNARCKQIIIVINQRICVLNINFRN
jgi:hypothetical protein